MIPLKLDEAMKKVDNEELREKMRLKAGKIANLINPLPKIKPLWDPVEEPKCKDEWLDRPVPEKKVYKKRETDEEKMERLRVMAEKKQKKEENNSVVREYTEEEAIEEAIHIRTITQVISEKKSQDRINQELDKLSKTFFD